MLWTGLIALTASSKWLCTQIDTQYQIIHDELEKIEHPLINGLKKIVDNYWERNHHHCFNDLTKIQFKK